MKPNESSFKLEVDQSYPNLCKSKVIVPKEFVDIIFNQAVLCQQNYIQAYGFPEGQVPLEYIKENFKKNLLDETQEFLLKFFVISFLYKELREKRILTAGNPNLKKIDANLEKGIEYHFEFTLLPEISNIEEWKYVVFNPPKRKKYKDIDRQVTEFLKNEKDVSPDINTQRIESEDWVCFDISLLDKNNEPLFDNHTANFWLKIGSEEADNTFSELFLNKKVNDEFITQAEGFQEFFSSKLNSSYNFLIKIKDIVSNSYFSLDHLKQHFKLKTNKEAQRHLIQIFSYRNDMSQRRETVEELFHLLFSKHQVEIPSFLILRQQEFLIKTLHSNPDYQVYKVQHDFNDKVKELANKQLKETVLIDQVAAMQKINIDHYDIVSYLNLTQRQKTKEFIYFDLISSQVPFQEIPIPTELLKQICLREKTLNYVINYLLR